MIWTSYACPKSGFCAQNIALNDIDVGIICVFSSIKQTSEDLHAAMIIHLSVFVTRQIRKASFLGLR